MSGTDIGRNIKAAREAKGWTQQELADAIKTKLDTLRKLEQGAIEQPRNLADYAAALGWSEAELRFGRSTGPVANVSDVFREFLRTPEGRAATGEQLDAVQEAVPHATTVEELVAALAALPKPEEPAAPVVEAASPEPSVRRPKRTVAASVDEEHIPTRLEEFRKRKGLSDDVVRRLLAHAASTGRSDYDELLRELRVPEHKKVPDRAQTVEVTPREGTMRLDDAPRAKQPKRKL